jgi:hypothetical protein
MAFLQPESRMKNTSLEGLTDSAIPADEDKATACTAMRVLCGPTNCTTSCDTLHHLNSAFFSASTQQVAKCAR